MTIQSLLEYTRRGAVGQLSDASRIRVAQIAAAFDAHKIHSRASINIFTFHAQVPDHLTLIDKIDVQRDNATFDYKRMAEHLLWSAEIFCRSPIVYFVTGPDDPWLVHTGVNVRRVRLKIDPQAIMFERVLAMCAYVHSTAFDRNTAFLDTDAFPNADLASVFERPFDVAVTYRTDPELMPINEGALFAAHENKSAIQQLFIDYLAIYESLCRDQRTIEYYGDIKAWRGGQLSLNTLTLPVDWEGGACAYVRGQARIILLACDQFNFSPEDPPREGELSQRRLDEKYIIHLKGSTKSRFGEVAAYQRGRASASPAFAAPMAAACL